MMAFEFQLSALVALVLAVPVTFIAARRWSSARTRSRWATLLIIELALLAMFCIAVINIARL